MLENVYEGLNARPKVYLSKEYFCELYPTCVSSKLCEFIFQVRMVGNTQKCSINAPFFVLPDCRTSLSYDYYLLRVFFLPSHLLFSWRHCCCMDNWTTWCPPGLQDCRSGHWTAGSSCLEEEWQALASGGRALIRIGDGS